MQIRQSMIPDNKRSEQEMKLTKTSMTDSFMIDIILRNRKALKQMETPRSISTTNRTRRFVYIPIHEPMQQQHITNRYSLTGSKYERNLPAPDIPPPPREFVKRL